MKYGIFFQKKEFEYRGKKRTYPVPTTFYKIALEGQETIDEVAEAIASSTIRRIAPQFGDENIEAYILRNNDASFQYLSMPDIGLCVFMLNEIPLVVDALSNKRAPKKTGRKKTMELILDDAAADLASKYAPVSQASSYRRNS